MKKNNLMTLRRLHGRINDAWVNYKRRCFLNKMVRSSVRKSQKEIKEELDDSDLKIDFVVTWVDGNDPDWLFERAKYTNSKNETDINNDVSRYREWDIFRYWFRAVEQNASWVNKVYLVTCGHVPSWLNTCCPRLRIIKHEDIIPKEYLPTFNSHTIEWFLWNIPELSEHFVYFNDDLFIAKPLTKKDFFVKELPRYCAIAKPIRASVDMNAHRHARFNCVGLINSAFDVSHCISQYPQKWFNHQYYDDVEYNIRAYKDGFISGMVYNHLGIPFRKTVMKEFCKRFSEQIKKTCKHRVRSSDDIMHQAVQMWEIFNGNFEPVGVGHFGKMFFVDEENVSIIENEIKEGKARMICINDHENLSAEEFSKVQKRIKDAFEKRYPKKSSFEL